MSDSNTDHRRTRRRAVRSVGPPAEETASLGVTSVPADSVGAGQASTAEPEQQPGNEQSAVVSAAQSDTDAEKVAAPAPDASAARTDDVVEPVAADDKTVDLAKTPTVPAADEQDADAQNSTDPKKRVGAGRIAAMAAAAVLVLALLAGAGLAAVQAHSIDTRDARRTEYVQTARQAILNLTTIRADSAKEDIDRILAVASGQFKNEFDGRVDPFMNIVQQAKVVSHGEIVEAAVESDDKDSAKVLVAAKQTLTNAGQEGPQTRFYRFRVTVSRGDSGLSVSKVEFVA
ncbi:hypothetical protein [Nocardia iowensis]|uniref:Mce-associated membrane protein n=1 Tax=Nocardia iowensis TaxID=204891 RepID=A0ABX8RRE4_NOCIO|nr:hypothetical protein [Nocardia iowensis]QXN92212.1 hypothetical protein KV110_03320 [Nocardia iowensis]